MRIKVLNTGVLLILLAALVSPQASLAQSREPVVEAVRAAGPAVVNIAAKGEAEQRSSFGDPFFDRFFSDFFDSYPQRRPTSSLGSGVIIDGEKGYVLTNHHVVEKAREVTVTLADQTELKARVVGLDPGSDLAVLQVEKGKSLPTISLGDSDKLLIGQRLIAIGNPFGLSHTVTTGVVSALNRTFKVQGDLFFGFIQTDAAINPGNSGGALLNIDGGLVGINTAIYAQAQGIGFAIPINRARRIAAELIAHGRVRPSWLGLSIQTLTPDLGLHFSVPGNRGVIVTSVEPGSPAQEAGLQKDDIIVRLDTLPITAREGFNRARADYPPGRSMQLTVFRDGRKSLLKVTSRAVPARVLKDMAWRRYGFRVEALDPGQASRWRIPRNLGVRISRVRSGSAADRIGFKPGDVILSLADEEVALPQDLEEIVSRLDFDQPVKAVVQRDRTKYLITLKPEG